MNKVLVNKKTALIVASDSRIEKKNDYLECDILNAELISTIIEWSRLEIERVEDSFFSFYPFINSSGNFNIVSVREYPSFYLEVKNTFKNRKIMKEYCELLPKNFQISNGDDVTTLKLTVTLRLIEKQSVMEMVQQLNEIKKSIKDFYYKKFLYKNQNVI
jgi:hypothetical protein